ncbi:hypothetical protein T484DRAFT_1917755, partial [Baffinella frigidus]
MAGRGNEEQGGLGDSSAMFHDALENASWAGQSEGSLYHSTVGQQPSLRGSSLQSEAAFSLGSVYLEAPEEGSEDGESPDLSAPFAVDGDGAQGGFGGALECSLLLESAVQEHEPPLEDEAAEQDAVFQQDLVGSASEAQDAVASEGDDGGGVDAEAEGDAAVSNSGERGGEGGGGGASSAAGESESVAGGGPGGVSGSEGAVSRGDALDALGDDPADEPSPPAESSPAGESAVDAAAEDAAAATSEDATDEGAPQSRCAPGSEEAAGADESGVGAPAVSELARVEELTPAARELNCSAPEFVLNFAAPEFRPSWMEAPTPVFDAGASVAPGAVTNTRATPGAESAGAAQHAGEDATASTDAGLPSRHDEFSTVNGDGHVPTGSERGAQRGAASLAASAVSVAAQAGGGGGEEVEG